jgi:hypothetical protein
LTSVSTRQLKWPADLPELERLDTGFDTDVVYDVQRQLRGFSLVELAVHPPLRKRFSPDWRELTDADVAVVCELGTRIVGAASMSCERWNRRAVISHPILRAEWLYARRPRHVALRRTTLRTRNGAVLCDDARGRAAVKPRRHRSRWVYEADLSYPSGAD